MRFFGLGLKQKAEALLQRSARGRASPVVLLCHQRSGSHLTEEILNSLASVKALDEVCNTRTHRLDDPVSFLGFRQRWAMTHPSYAYLPEEQHTVIAAYLRHLGTLFGQARFVCIDVKYSSLTQFEAEFWPPMSRPMLLEFCRRNAVPVIHLFRQDQVAARCSDAIAHATGVWHSWKGDPDRQLRLTLDARRVADEAALLRRQIAWLQQMLLGARVLEITYEAVVASLASDGAIIGQIGAFVGAAPGANPVIAQRKVTPPLEECVTNIAEIRSRFAELAD